MPNQNQVILKWRIDDKIWYNSGDTIQVNPGNYTIYLSTPLPSSGKCFIDQKYVSVNSGENKIVFIKRQDCEYIVDTNITNGSYGSVNPEFKLVKHNKQTEFLIEPNEGYTIDSITGCNGHLTMRGTDIYYITDKIIQPCTINIKFRELTEEDDEHEVLIQRFKSNIRYHTKRIFVPYNTSIDIDKESPVLIPDGFKFSQLIGITGTWLNNIFTTDLIKAPIIIKVFYEREILTVSTELCETEPHGTVTPSTQQIQFGERATVQVIPDKCYNIDYVRSNCSPCFVDSGIRNFDTFTTSPITEDCVINVCFKEIIYRVRAYVISDGSFITRNLEGFNLNNQNHLRNITVCRRWRVTRYGIHREYVYYDKDNPCHRNNRLIHRGGVILPPTQNVRCIDERPADGTFRIGWGFEFDKIIGCGGVDHNHDPSQQHTYSTTYPTNHLTTPANTWITENIITQNCNVILYVKIKKYLIRAIVVPNPRYDDIGGEATPEEQYVKHGDFARINFKAKYGYEIHQVWSGDCTGRGYLHVNYSTHAPSNRTRGTYIRDPIFGECTVYVQFRKKRYLVRASSNWCGSVSPVLQWVYHGDMAVIKFQSDRVLEYVTSECGGRLNSIDSSWIINQILNHCIVRFRFDCSIEVQPGWNGPGGPGDTGDGTGDGTGDVDWIGPGSPDWGGPDPGDRWPTDPDTGDLIMPGDDLPEVLGPGIMAGVLECEGELCALIISPRDEGHHECINWKIDNTITSGSNSTCNGHLNTQNMLDGKHPAATWAANLVIDGVGGWALPAADQLEMLYRVFKPTRDSNDTTNYIELHELPNGSNPNSMYSEPYVTDYPELTDIYSFRNIYRQVGFERFNIDAYWSSTRINESNKFPWVQDFKDGYQHTFDEAAANRNQLPNMSSICLPARAVRCLNFTVNAESGPNGSISPASVTLLPGETHSFTITPASGYMIDEFITDCDGTRVGFTYTLDPITRDCSIGVTFKEQPPPCSLQTTSGGQGTTVHEVYLSDIIGRVTFWYDAYGLYDRFIVDWDGVRQFDTGNVTHQGTRTFCKSKAEPMTATVTVIGPPGTGWVYNMGCPVPIAGCGA